MGKQRLELTWIGKNSRPKLEPRLLIEDPEKSYGSSETENMLIHGDNLLALKALEQDYSGKVKCIYIDPPYNTGSAFSHYDDGLEHSIWLSLIRDRLIILWSLLDPIGGSIWISIDDNEVHYLKVLCDEIFGRNCFISNVVWEKDKGRRSDTSISAAHDHILLYAKNPTEWRKIRNKLPRTADQESRYKNPDNDPRGPWLQGDNGTARSGSEAARFPITTPSGRIVTPSAGRYWAFSKDTFENARSEGRVYFGRNGDGMPIIKRYLAEVQDGVVPRTWWTADEAGHNQEAKRDHLNKLLKDITVFDTPKPERLIERILVIATNPGDLVLDSFLGSGTTAAVAQKMDRKWIGVELGDHCYSHSKVRIDKVISGDDPFGISKSLNWNGGGGYKFYELAPSLLNKDAYGNWIINQEYNADMLAAAMAKQEGFKYNPDPDFYWKQGQSTEQDFIFTTTEFLTQEHAEFIHSQMKEGESLLICCKAFNANDSHFSNITIKKIPKMLMGKCEFGKDDYSLNIINIPIDDNEEEFPDSVSEPKPKYVAGQAELFDLEGDNE